MSRTACRDVLARCPLLVVGLLGLIFAAASCRAQTAHTVGEITSFGSGFNNPHGIALDVAGNLYVADYGSGQVYEEALQADGSYSQSVLFPGNGYGTSIDVARDRSGNFYIAGGGVVTKESVQAGGGYVATTIGSFHHPVGVAVDGSGNVFVVDDSQSSLFELAAGTYAQTTLDANTLPTPFAVSVDASGNLYVGTVRGTSLEKYTPGQGGYAKSDVVPTEGAYGVIADLLGNLLYASPTQFLKAIYRNGSYSEQVFSPYRLQTLTEDAQGVIYGLSYFDSTGIRINPAPSFGQAAVGTTATRQISVTFTVDTAGAFGTPAVVTQGTGGLDFSLVSSTCTGTLAAQSACTATVSFTPKEPGIRKGGIQLLDTAGNILASAPLSGVGTAPQGVVYAGTQTTLIGGLSSGAVTTDAAGDVYVAGANAVVAKETAATGGYSQSSFGTGFGSISALAVDGLGNVFVADSAQQQVAEEAFLPASGTYAQQTLFTANANDLGSIGAIAVDGGGAVYVGNGTQLVKDLPYGGAYLQSTLASGFGDVAGLAVDGAGDVFVADSGTGTLYKEVPSTGGAYLQSTLASGLGSITGLSLDAGGTLYVTAPGTGDGVLRFVASGSGTYAQGPPVTGFTSPAGVALDGSANLDVVSPINGSLSLSRLDVSDPETLTFSLTAVGQSSAVQTVTLTNTGNTTLSLSGLATSSANFTVDSSITTCMATGSLAPGATCVVGVKFTPQIAGPLRGTLNITDNNLNQAATVQTVILNATAMGPVAISVSNVSVVYGTATASLTASVAYAGTVAPSGTLSFTVGQGASVTAACVAGGAVLTCTATYPVAGLAVGSYVITATELASTYYSAATGTGTLTVTAAVVPGFTFTNSGAISATVSAGASTSFNFSLSPTGSGYPGEVTFAVTGLPTTYTYSLTPSTVSASSGQQTVQLAIQTQAAATSKAKNESGRPPWWKPVGILAAVVVPFGLSRRRRSLLRSGVQLLLVAGISLGVLGGLTGCGFTGVYYQVPSSYVVTVTATSGSVQQSAQVTLTVQ